jgi:hypothetical protein
MQDFINHIAELQIKLFAEISREIEHGASQRETLEALAHTMSDKIKVPTSTSWVQTFVKSKPRDLVHGSFARIQGLQKLIEEQVHIWD